MPLLTDVSRKSFKGRVFVATLYILLTLMGITMVVPFMITLSSSTANEYDYDRFLPVPRYIYSQSDRCVKGLVYFFRENDKMRAYLPQMKANWVSWRIMGEDAEGSSAFGAQMINDYLTGGEKSKLIARDYGEFAANYDVTDCMVKVIDPQAVKFMEQYYTTELEREKPESRKWSYSDKINGALEVLAKRWGLPYESFFGVSFETEIKKPLHFQKYFPELGDAKYQDFERLKEAYHAHVFTPGVRGKWLKHLQSIGYKYESEKLVFPVMRDAPADLQKIWKEFSCEIAPASPCVPFPLRSSWYAYLTNDATAKKLKLKDGKILDIDTYNRMAGTKYKTLQDTPFPLPPKFAPKLRGIWNDFLRNEWPLRLTTIKLSDSTQLAYAKYLQKEIKHIRIANQLLGTKYTDWKQFKVAEKAPEGIDLISKNVRSVWLNFTSKQSPEERIMRSSETVYQRFLLKKYGSLAGINKAYGWNLKYIEEAFPAFETAYIQTFLNNETAFTWVPIFENFEIIFNYLFLNSSALFVTIVLIALSILCTLTINPIAAYALSRFRLRGKELIILFMLSTMAFPAMVSAIPAYLLMRDLGLLNTFLALVLPGAASGMAIFILKGFFDSLPAELYEAATIDGASEFQIFRIVAMPMVKPILAINCLNAFIAAYNGWGWALIICQKQSMWTIAVWMYQATFWWGQMPWVIMAGFVITSIPTLIAFVSCQKMILRGIVLPSMK